MDLAAVTLIALGFLSTFALSALFVEVAKEDMARERTATDEMWARTIEFYRNENARSVDGRDGRESRIGEYAPTTNNTRSMWE
jgi:hypothetical protein